MATEDPRSLPDVVRFQLRRHLVQAHGHRLAEEGEMPVGRLAGQLVECGGDPVDLVGVRPVLPGQVRQVAGPEGGFGTIAGTRRPTASLGKGREVARRRAAAALRYVAKARSRTAT